MRKHTTKTPTIRQASRKMASERRWRKSQRTFVPSIVGRAYTFVIRKRFNDAVT